MVNHFLSLTDFSSEEIEALLALALRLKKERSEGGIRRTCAAKCWE